MSAAQERAGLSHDYKQAVYGPKESKIGDVDDVVVDKLSNFTGLVIGVGGFPGAGEKDVIVLYGSEDRQEKR